jgi:anaerobic ribonucleoside-triphosphate reductase activating protein
MAEAAPASRAAAPLLNLAGTVGDSIVDGPGIRFAVFAQGCRFSCPGCQNPQTHEFGIGVDTSVDELVDRVRRNPLVKGVTFSGGDPFFQAKGFAVLAARLKALGYETASYTGFTWEALVAEGHPDRMALLRGLDILVDGPFVLARRNLELRFRGSDNQRIIDVSASLAALGRGDSSPVLCSAKRWVG